jgi:quinol monooxygenase YgiN
MLKVGLFVRLEAKKGKEAELATFLEKGLEMANAESFTPLWFALKFGPSTFAVFDAFQGEEGRQSHLTGEIAKALVANAPQLLASSPSIEKFDVLGAKLPG